jgi:protein-disulfide isomerase
MATAGLKRSALLGLSVLLCCIGWWLSFGLLQLHDGTAPASITAGELISHLCHADADEPSGCLASSRSPWSEVRLPLPGEAVEVPVAFLAIAYFIALGCWATFIGDAQTEWKPLGWLPIAVAVAGIYASLFFVSLMAMGRAPWCGGCFAVHLTNLLLVISIAARLQYSRRMVSSSPPASHRQCAAVIAFAIVLIGTLYHSRTQRVSLQNQVADLQVYQRMVESLQRNSDLMMSAYLGGPKKSIPLRPDEVDAKEQHPAGQHTLVEFLDYECPACLITSGFVNDEVQKDFDGKLNVIIRHYPLCKTCNPKIPKTIHPNACQAAYAAEAARSIGGRSAFDRMGDFLFANQLYLTDMNYRELATQVGLDPEQLVKRMDDPTVRNRVDEDIALAHSLGVTNTPTLFLDGRQVPQICMASAFWKAIAKKPVTDLISN